MDLMPSSLDTKRMWHSDIQAGKTLADIQLLGKKPWTVQRSINNGERQGLPVSLHQFRTGTSVSCALSTLAGFQVFETLWSLYTWGPFFRVWSFSYRWTHFPWFPSFYLHNLLFKTSLPRESVLWLLIQTNPLINPLYLILSWLFTALNRMCSSMAANLCFSFFNICYLPARCSEDHPGKNPYCSIKNIFYYI